MTKVSWRKAIAAMAAVAAVLGALIVVVRSDGLPAVDAASSRATAWFVYRDRGTAVLADGYGGRALATVPVATAGEQVSIVESASGAYVLNDALGEIRALDTAQVRVGSPVALRALGSGNSISAATRAGLVVVDPDSGEASLLPTSGDTLLLDVEVGDDIEIDPDGNVWSIVDDRLVRSSIAEITPGRALGVDDASLSLAGSRPLVLDRTNRRVFFGDGTWQTLPTDAPPSELVLQEPGPPADCGWVGSGDQLWCVGTSGIDERVDVAGLGLSGSDRLAIAGDAAVALRGAPTEIVRFDWRTGEIFDRAPPSVAPDATLQVTATVDLIWIDDTAGNTVWSVHPWGLETIDKGGSSALELGETGEVVDGDRRASDGSTRATAQAAEEKAPRKPDNNGIDDPPVAVDDPVTARAGALVTIPVTANDWDPDGEAIGVVAVDQPLRGTAEIATADEVTYQPNPGYVGLDKFKYTITDGNGTTASATVYIDLVPVDAANRPPVGSPDQAQTGPGVEIVVDVLLNDVDPERDSLRIGSFTPPPPDSGVGTVSEILGPSDLPALRYRPEPGFEGTARFTYRPIDSFGAVGDEVEVLVEVARQTDPNRPPVTRPDAVRVRRETLAHLNVLKNDVDPDGDSLLVSVVEPLPAGLEVDARGDWLDIVVRAGADRLLPFQYEVDDEHGHQVRGAVLVEVIDDDEPNRPPIVNADSHTAVVGESVLLDVTSNDSDPDGDPLTIVDVTQPDDEGGEVTIFGTGRIEFYAAELPSDEERATVRFNYTVSDGLGHEVEGEVTVVILPEPLPEPPWAQDDSTFTLVDTPVVIDVLRNDRDPSGETPALVGTPGCPAGGRAVRTTDGLVRYTPPRGQSGVFRCTYEVRNSQNLPDTASIVISVQEPSESNQPPRAVTDTVSVEVGRMIPIRVTANDIDPDGDRRDLVVLSSTSSPLGEAVRVDNTIEFTAGQATGTTTIKYQIADAEGAIALGNVQITVTARSNRPPVARNARQSDYAPAPAALFSRADLVSDPDDNLEDLVLAASSSGSAGSYTVRSTDSTITIIPAPDYTGRIEVGYTVTDPDGATGSGVLVYEVSEQPNRAPVAVDDAATVANGASTTVPVLLNDSDLDGDQLTMRITSSPDSALGTATKVDNSISFASVAGQSGTAVIGYSISDGQETANATLRVTVLPCAESFPVARSAFLMTGYRQPIEVNLASYASNGEVNTLSAPPGYAGNLYTPPPGENGNVAITYEVVNSCRQRATGTIEIDVNQAPSPQHQDLTMSRGATLSIPIGSLAGDAEPLTVSAMSGAPSWATVSEGALRLAPPTSAAHGNYAWTLTVSDPGGLTAQVNVGVTLTNASPVANDDTIDLTTGVVFYDIVDNDSDPDDANGDLRVLSLPAEVTFSGNGVSAPLTLHPDGRRVRIDAGGATGRATFTYTITDPADATSNRATVTVIGLPTPTTTTTTTTTTTIPPTTTRPPTTTTTTTTSSTTTTTRPPRSTTTTTTP